MLPKRLDLRIRIRSSLKLAQSPADKHLMTMNWRVSSWKRLTFRASLVGMGIGVIVMHQNLTQSSLIHAAHIADSDLLENQCSNEIRPDEETVTVGLDEFSITLDRATGTITRILHSAFSPMIWAEGQKSGLFTLSMPTQEFLGLQLEPEFSPTPRLFLRVNGSPGLCMIWSWLGSDRRELGKNFGNTKVAVQITPGSIGFPQTPGLRFRIQVRNHDPFSVSQVLFPDFKGLQPLVHGGGLALQEHRLLIASPYENIGPFSPEFTQPERELFYPHANWRRLRMTSGYDEALSVDGLRYLVPWFEPQNHLVSILRCAQNGFVLRELSEEGGTQIATEALVQLNGLSSPRLALRLSQSVPPDHVWTSRGYLLTVSSSGGCP